MPPVIELHSLEVRFGQRTILNKLSGALTGRAIGLLGPNGAGKSTLINTLLGFHKPWTRHGAHLRLRYPHARTGQAGARRSSATCRRTTPSSPSMSGVRFVRLMAELAGLPPEQALERAHEAFFYVGLGEARYRNLGTYSPGMKQLAKLAQAIAHGPRLLFLDEPTNGLDPPARQRMIRLIQEIRDQRRPAPDPLLAPAARRGGVLRRGADPQGRQHRRHLRPGGGAPRQPPLPGAGDARRQRQLPRSHRADGLRNGRLAARAASSWCCPRAWRSASSTRSPPRSRCRSAASATSAIRSRTSS